MKVLTLALWAFTLLGSFAYAEDVTLDELNDRLEKLENTDQRKTERIKELEETLKKQSSTEDMFSRVTWHGYAEIHLNIPKTGTMDDSAVNEIDIHRFDFGLSYEFSDRIRFEGELDFEHAAKEIELEYAHFDFDLNPDLTLRAGAILMPIGYLNELHEPTLFYSVERPNIMKSIIPTTWQENGIGLVGTAMDGELTFRTYIVAGLDASKFTTIDGLRKGRSHGGNSKVDDIAITGRVEQSPLEGLSLGLSGYLGGADQSHSALGSVTVSLIAFDATYEISDFEFSTSLTQIGISNADEISALTGETIGKTMDAWHLEIAYNAHVQIMGDEEEQRLVPFLRHERFDTNSAVASGYARDGRADRTVWTFGLAFYPVSDVVIKTDYEFWNDDSAGPDDSIGRFNVGIGVVF